MLQYSLEVGICWAILYLVYIAFLRKETFFSANRWYLLCSLFLGLLIPVLKTIPAIFQEKVVAVNEALYFIAAGPELIAANLNAVPVEPSILTLQNLLILVYGLGFLFAASRLLIGLIRIKRLYSGGQRTNKGTFILVETEGYHLPFSFLNCIFFSKELELNENLEKILKHELTHVKSWHTMDILFVEFLQVIFWFNPFLILYKRAIKESHEYVADATVLQDTSQKIYGQILLRQSQSGLQIALANHFFHSHIKKRLTMMKQEKSKRPALIKYLLAIPFVLLLAVLFQSQTIPNQDRTSSTNSFEEELNEAFAHENAYTEVKELIARKAQPSNLSIIEYGNSDTIPPPPPPPAPPSLEGNAPMAPPPPPPPPSKAEVWQLINDPTADVQVFINEQKVSTSEALAKKESLFLRSISMDNKNAKKVSVIKFSTEENKTSAEEIFKVVEQMPRFPGCEDMEGSNYEKEDCAKKKMLEFIYTNLRYPEEARTSGIEGTNVVQFVIKPDGSLSEAKLVRDIGGGTGEATLKMMRKMGELPIKWNPGYQRGKAVSVQYTLPVRFKLAGQAKEAVSEAKKVTIENNTDPTVQPLIVLDGVKQSKLFFDLNKSLDPNDIEKMNVLKGESATNMYGADGEYGVIEIVTKKRTKKQNETKPKSDSEELFKVVEQMPRFPGCEDLDGNKAEIESCSKKQLLKFIYTNLNYPAAARESGYEGVAVVQFVIDKNGQVKDEKVVRDINGAFAETIYTVIDEMRLQNKIWTPGMQRGKAVNVLFTMPVRFKLEGDVKINKPQEQIEDPNNIETVVTAWAPDKTLTVSSISTLNNVQLDYNTDKAGDAKISVFNAAGQLILSKGIQVTKGKNVQQLNINNNMPGFYIITIEQGSSRITKKAILQN